MIEKTVQGPMNPPVVYVVDDDDSMRAALAGLLASVGLHVRLFTSARNSLQSLSKMVQATWF